MNIPAAPLGMHAGLTCHLLILQAANERRQLAVGPAGETNQPDVVKRQRHCRQQPPQHGRGLTAHPTLAASAYLAQPPDQPRAPSQQPVEKLHTRPARDGRPRPSRRPAPRDQGAAAPTSCRLPAAATPGRPPPLHRRSSAAVPQVAAVHKGTLYEIGPCSSGQEADLVCAVLKSGKRCSCIFFDRLATCCLHPSGPAPAPVYPCPVACLLTRFAPCPVIFAAVAKEAARVQDGPATAASFDELVEQLRGCCREVATRVDAGAKAAPHPPAVAAFWRGHLGFLLTPNACDCCGIVGGACCIVPRARSGGAAAAVCSASGSHGGSSKWRAAAACSGLWWARSCCTAAAGCSP